MASRPKLVVLQQPADRSHRWLMSVLRQTTAKAREVKATSAVVVLVGPRETFNLVAGNDRMLLLAHVEVAKHKILVELPAALTEL